MSTTIITPTSSAAIEAPKLVKKPSSDAKGTTHNTYGCDHVKGLLQAARKDAIDGYTRVLGTIQRTNKVSYCIHKTAEGTTTTSKITYLCLQCPNVNNTGERHKKEHSFAIESHNGHLLCHDCYDFVYDPTFEDLRLSGTATSRKRKHSQVSGEPGDRRLVATNTSSNSCAATGLRGIYNMGQTCFMSVILQSLIHNPFIRAFYLNEGHKSVECEREACTSCALDEIFTDFYGQEKHEGYGAVHMLQGCWKSGGDLAGYSQQDAHEYLGSMLNSLHTAILDDDDDPTSLSRDAKNCDCVIHKTFGGLYRSTVTCKACKNTTTTYDTFTDLSLDIKSSGVSVKKKKLPAANGTKDAIPVELTECLDRFTSAETLSSDSYSCRKCDKAADAEKRLKLHSLPPVLPIHLKRFSHSKTSSQSTKIDTRVRFPFTLNLTTYTTANLAVKGKPAKKVPDSNDDDDDDEPEKPPEQPKPDPVYWLSSVVVHKGKIDNGHYISYSRQGDEWFRFDDSMVVKVDDKEVLSSEAYMLFYVIQDLDACAS